MRRLRVALIFLAQQNLSNIENMQNYQKIFMLLALALPPKESLAGEGVATPNDKYKSVLEISATNYRKRPISEVDLMIPMWQNHNNLIIFDIKLKKDRKSFEYNLGLVYRYNFDDRWIFGLYSYFDRRRTEHKLEANQWTFGTEALSLFFDARFNFYLPKNKKRTIYTKPRELRRDHTAIYAVSEGKFLEHTLPGYDMEVGTPLFGFFPKMDNKFGTKVYVTKYNFARKGVAKNSGLRLRLEQKLFEDRFKDSHFSITLHLGTHYTNRKKWDNFVGLSLRVPLSQDRPNRTKIQERMMDTVVRDVDIRTEKRISQPREPLHLKGKPIDNVYFVADGGCNGDGSSSSPYCVAEYQEKLKDKKPGFMVVPIGNFTEAGYNTVMKHPDAVDHITHDVALATGDLNSVFSVKDHFPELKLVKSSDNPINTYSAVTAIHEPEQIAPEARERESMSPHGSYLQDNSSATYTNAHEKDAAPYKNEQQERSSDEVEKRVAEEIVRQEAEEHARQAEKQRLVEQARLKKVRDQRKAQQEASLSKIAQALSSALDEGKESANVQDFKRSTNNNTNPPAPKEPQSTKAKEINAVFKAGQNAAAVQGFRPLGSSSSQIFVPKEPKSENAIIMNRHFTSGKKAGTSQGFQPQNKSAPLRPRRAQ